MGASTNTFINHGCYSTHSNNTNEVPAQKTCLNITFTGPTLVGTKPKVEQFLVLFELRKNYRDLLKFRTLFFTKSKGHD